MTILVIILSIVLVIVTISLIAVAVDHPGSNVVNVENYSGTFQLPVTVAYTNIKSQELATFDNVFVKQPKVSIHTTTPFVSMDIDAIGTNAVYYNTILANNSVTVSNTHAITTISQPTLFKIPGTKIVLSFVSSVGTDAAVYVQRSGNNGLTWDETITQVMTWSDLTYDDVNVEKPAKEITDVFIVPFIQKYGLDTVVKIIVTANTNIPVEAADYAADYAEMVIVSATGVNATAWNTPVVLTDPSTSMIAGQSAAHVVHDGGVMVAYTSKETGEGLVDTIVISTTELPGTPINVFGGTSMNLALCLYSANNNSTVTLLMIDPNTENSEVSMWTATCANASTLLAPYWESDSDESNRPQIMMSNSANNGGFKTLAFTVSHGLEINTIIQPYLFSILEDNKRSYLYQFSHDGSTIQSVVKIPLAGEVCNYPKLVLNVDNKAILSCIVKPSSVTVPPSPSKVVYCIMDQPGADPTWVEVAAAPDKTYASSMIGDECGSVVMTYNTADSEANGTVSDFTFIGAAISGGSYTVKGDIVS